MEFKNFISLGFYCGVAASMSKLGIRSQSGPFDWYISEFQGVLDCLQDDFRDFLCKENLEVCANGTAFRDIKHNFYLGHEITVSFEHDYGSIYEKYMRRISVFREQIAKPTCFVRAVQNDNELDFIKENIDYINTLIKKKNTENEIIYIVRNEMSAGKDLDYPFFTVDFFYDRGTAQEIRKLFDGNMRIQEFLLDRFDENMRYRNMVFDLQKENRKLEYQYDLMKKINFLNLKKDIPREIIIYGAGNVGKSFYQKVNKICKVLFFLDKNPKASSYEGVRIVQDKKIMREYSEIPIIVTACYEYEQIRESLLIEVAGLNIFSLVDFLI